ncbi:MAG: NAD(P)H-hydrate epimerase, partial [Candidatus Cloacimonetes bacterium]|nr:NAD(P)H-hydrate epimerase [Candidatus Cloacimonadota bacterium]
MFVLSREEMYQYDNYTINVSGIPGEELMENAGKGCSEIIHKEILAEKGKVVIFCGSGNNGGDGFVIARYLRQWGHQVVVVLTGDQENMSPETQVNFQKCLTMKISWCHVTSLRAWQEAKIQLAEFDLIIDAIFGVGLKAPLRGWWGELIEIMNKASVLKVSVDIPSGVDANTGYSPHAFCADHTLTMANYKYGHLIETGRLCSGEVKIIDIGIDPAVYEKFPPRGRMITEEDVVYPSRSRFHHKGGYGRIAIIGGSPGYSGAAIMACQAALRAGAGLITLFHPPGMELIFESQLLEVMTFSLPVDNAEKLDWDTLERKLDQNDVILIGPGMGTGKTATRLVEYVVKNW